MENAFHYPADLLNLLIETIPRLCRSKRDVITFFRGCGVPQAMLADLESELRTDPEAVRKSRQVETVLTQLNVGGDRFLRLRREVIKRVTETEDFSTCWESDRLIAVGLVSQVRARVQKHDAFARMAQERDAAATEARKRQEAELASQQRRRQELAKAHGELCALFRGSDPQRRGRALEGILNRYFASEGVGVREAFTFREVSEDGILEQIDGVIELDSHLYLVEIKWWDKPLGPGAVAQHMVRVAQRGEVRGLVISASGYTGPALVMCRNQLQLGVFVLCELQELVLWLERGEELAEKLLEKVRRAQIDKEPLHRTF